MMNSGSLDARSPYSSALLTDLYELTMACAFWKSGIAGRELRRVGRELWGIRLDSRDLAYLGIQARRILDDAGFPNANIIGSNGLDEHIIASLKQQGAAINAWGVGTKW